MALDLLQKPLDDLSKDERRELDGVARKMHRGGVAAFVSPPDESPPPTPTADIGMSKIAQLEGWLRERRQTEPPKPRQLTCDEIAARQAEREATEKKKRKERDERLREAREVAHVFAEAQRAQDDRGRYEEQRLLRDVDPSFVERCRSRGITDPREIYMRWQESAYARRYVDPTKGPSGW